MAVYAGKSLLRRYKGAVADRNMQREAHRGFTASLPPDLVGGWGMMCTRWDADGFPKTVPNPFYTTDTSEFYHLMDVYLYQLNDTLSGISEDDVLKQLSTEETATRRAAGTAALHSTSPSAFLILGLELEESQ